MLKEPVMKAINLESIFSLKQFLALKKDFSDQIKNLNKQKDVIENAMFYLQNDISKQITKKF